MDQTVKINRQTNPRKDANIFSIVTFAYMIPTLIKGYLKKLEEFDVPKILDEHCAAKLGNKLEQVWNKEKSSKKPSLWRAIQKVFGLEFSILGMLLAVDELILKLLRPLAVVQLLKYYSESEDDKISSHEALTCAGVLIGISILSSVIYHFATLSLQVLGMKIRVACCSLIYRKSLTLNRSALEDVTVGKINNILSNDVGRIDSAVFTAHSIWLCPVQIILTLVIMNHMIGILSTVGVLVMVILVVLQAFLGKKASQLRLKTALQTDARVRLMTEIIHGIKVIKMYTWEKIFQESVEERRRLEIREIRSANYIRSFLKCAIYSPKVGVLVAILAYVLTGNTLTVIYLFMLISFYDVLRILLCLSFIKGIADVAELRVSIERIREFLLVKGVPLRPAAEKQTHAGIELLDVTAKWRPNSEAILKHITLKVESSEHVAIVGPVGSGKSSIFELLSEELVVDSGKVTVNGNVSYASQEPWLFSGTIQQNILFGKPMKKGRYRDVIRVCALEQDLFLLPGGDQTLVGENGVNLSGGQKARVNLARALYFDADIYLLDDPFSAFDTQVGVHVFNSTRKFLDSKCTVIVTHQLQYLNRFNKIYLIERGQISAHGTITDILQFDSEFTKDLGCRNDCPVEDNDKNSTSLCRLNVENEKQRNIDLDISSKIGPLVSYIKAGGSTTVFMLVMLLVLVSQVAVAAGEYFVIYWINHQQLADNSKENYQPTTSLLVYGYSAVIVCMIIILLLQGVAFFSFCTNSAITLHNKMFSGVMKTSIRFFNLNTSGSILCRFSKDMGIIDEQIPILAMETIQIGFRLLMSCIMICLSNVWLLVSTGLLFVGFYLVRHIYCRTKHQVKPLEATARSYIIGHLNESLQGISTVRAFRAHDILTKEFDWHQDRHSSVWYMSLSCTKTFLFYIDLICIAYCISIVFTLVLGSTEQSAGNVGLAITQAVILLVSQQWGMFQSTELENSMGSVERVAEYASLNREEHKNGKEPPTSWPQQGAVTFKHLSLQYSPSEPCVLKNLNFSIKPKEKVGVVGRTGAGKSSLVTALFQLSRTKGCILIDDIDISEIPLSQLRSKISIIPQEPVLFTGTLRKNLDPFNKFTDEDLWQSLEAVELKIVVSKLSLGLHHMVSEGGSNFSVGQRQLLCLARAILRRNKVLILDEATANVDPYTDALIQSTLRQKFKDCTVIAIAHRLNTIMDSDRVLVMHEGKDVEFDHPHLLLQRTNSLFYTMVQKTGRDTAKLLEEIAENSYKETGFRREET